MESGGCQQGVEDKLPKASLEEVVLGPDFSHRFDTSTDK